MQGLGGTMQNSRCPAAQAAGWEGRSGLPGCEGRWGGSRLGSTSGSWWLSNLKTLSSRSLGGAVTLRLPHLQIWFLLPHTESSGNDLRALVSSVTTASFQSMPLCQEPCELHTALHNLASAEPLTNFSPSCSLILISPQGH